MCLFLVCITYTASRKLVSHNDHEVLGMTSGLQCMRHCIQYGGFTCGSVEWYHSLDNGRCMMSPATSESHPDDLARWSATDLLEVIC